MIAALLLGPAVSGTALASALPLDDFTRLSLECAPRVAVETTAAVARTESGFDPLAIHDNTTGRTFKPATREEAIALATELVVVARHTVDLGLMQINSANFPRLGLTVTDAFDPCRSLAASELVLVEGYAPPGPGGDEQAALHQTLSRYNTGSPVRGLGRDAGGNGYVARVQSAAEVVVPAIRLRGEGAASLGAAAPLGGGAAITVQPLPPPPPSWDVYGQARAARGQAALVYGPNRPATPPSPPAVQPTAPVPVSSSVPSGPVQLRAYPSKQALTDAR